MRRLELRFVGESAPELFESFFQASLFGEERSCIRGRFNGAYQDRQSFPFTRSVIAMSVFFVKAVERQLNPKTMFNFNEPILIGASGSLAVSLDYAINKQPLWLLDMFGFDARGICNIRQIIRRTNSGRRWTGPVALALNTNYLAAVDIQIFLDGTLITSLAQAQALWQALEQRFYQSSQQSNNQALLIEDSPGPGPDPENLEFEYCGS